MSIRQIDAALESGLPPMTRYVLVALAWYADDDGTRVFPSAATLARRTGLTTRSIHTHLAILRAGGILEVVTPARATKPTVYRIHPCTTCTPEGPSPLKDIQGRGEGGSGVPLKDVPSTPEGASPNPSGIRQRDPSENGHRPRAAPRRAIQTAMPEPFLLTPDRQAFATLGGIDGTLEIGRFRDHHQAKGTRFANWDAAWRTWCRRAADFAPTPHPRGGRP